VIGLNTKDYLKYTNEKSFKSPIFKNCVLAFLVGGTICTIAQFFWELLSNYTSLDETSITGVETVIMIMLGVFLTAINIYDKIAKFGGAGTIVPITGFANAVASSAMDFKSEGLVFGLGSKMFSIVGPVIVYGTIISVVIGFIYYLA